MGLTRPRLGQFKTSTANFDDEIIVLNSSASGTNTKDIGIVFERGDDTNVALIWDESTDRFALINTTEEGSTQGNVTISSYANLTIGGFTANGLTYPTSDGTSGQFLVTDGSGTLSFSATSGGQAVETSSNVTFGTVTVSSASNSVPLKLENTTNAGAVGIEFNDITADTQLGYLKGHHADSQSGSPSAGYSFHFSSTEPTTNLVLDGGGVFIGTATSAQYADLAENYVAETNHPVGTVLIFGGRQEVTESTSKADRRLAGVVCL